MSSDAFTMLNAKRGGAIKNQGNNLFLIFSMSCSKRDGFGLSISSASVTRFIHSPVRSLSWRISSTVCSIGRIVISRSVARKASRRRVKNKMTNWKAIASSASTMFATAALSIGA